MFSAPSNLFTGQSLVFHAGGLLTGFPDALGFGRLRGDRVGQFVPAGARQSSGLRWDPLQRCSQSAGPEEASIGALYGYAL